MTSATMTVRLDNTLKLRLNRLAEATHRSKSFLAAEAINEYINLQEWQINEIRQGIAEADSGQLVDHEDITKYWEEKRAHSMDKRGETKFNAS